MIKLPHLIPPDPINLPAKRKALMVLACFSAILIVAAMSRYLVANPAYPIIVASMGASAVILFVMPTSPVAQPWPLLGGQLLSAAIGVSATQAIPDPAWASACAVGGSVLSMLLFRCLHPPGAATAIAPVIGGEAMTKLGFGFVLMPVAVNALVLLVMAIAFNRYLFRYQYPSFSPTANIAPPVQKTSALAGGSGISEQDVQQVLQNQEMYLDVSVSELNKLLSAAQRLHFKRTSAQLVCADIMLPSVTAVEYGTEVEVAWQLMHHGKFKALPVIDRARRVIGIISWNDFFNHLDQSQNCSFQEKLWTFIKRTPDISTTKPEVVGHMMTAPVSTLAESAHIVELIPLMSERNFGNIPIVNQEKRLVGMIDQARLIAALYGQQLG